MGADVGDLGEGLAEDLHVAGVAGLVESCQGAFDVADGAEGFAGFGEEEGMGDEGGDDVLSGDEWFGVAERVEDPVAEFAGAHGGAGAVEGGEERVFVAVAVGDEVEVGAAGGVDDDGVVAGGALETAEVGDVAAEDVAEVVEDGTGGAGGGGEVGEAEAVEGLDLKMVEEEVAGLVEEEGPWFEGGGTVEGGEFAGLVFAVEEFGGLEAAEFVEEFVEGGEFGGAEFAGGVVGEGEAEGFGAGAEDGGEVVVAPAFEHVEVDDGACGDDLGDFAFDEFTGDGFGGLFGDGDAAAAFDESGDVAFGGVEGDAAHGDVVAFGEGEVEDGGRGFGVFEEHFVEVAEPVEEDDVGRQGPPDGVVLLHHGGLAGV